MIYVLKVWAPKVFFLIGSWLLKTNHVGVNIPKFATCLYIFFNHLPDLWKECPYTSFYAVLVRLKRVVRDIKHTHNDVSMLNFMNIPCMQPSVKFSLPGFQVLLVFNIIAIMW
jgi:hypothetical protein